MALTLLTLDELESFILREMLRVPGISTHRGGDAWIESKLLGVLFHGNSAQAEWGAKQILPSTAEGDYLARHASDRGREKQLAAPAHGKVYLRMDDASAANTTQLAGSELTADDGSVYTTDGAATSALPAWVGKTTGTGCTTERISVNPDTTGMAVDDVIEITGVKRAIREVHTAISAVDVYEPFSAAPASGVTIDARRSVAVEITASAAGALGNKLAGEALTITSPAGAPPNQFLDAIVLELTGGGDEETQDELRGRTVDHFAHEPGAGNPEQFRTWARETPDVRVGECFVFTGFRGLGTIDLLPVGVSGQRYMGTSAGPTLALIDANVRDTASHGEGAHYADDVLLRELVYRSPSQNVDLTVEPRLGWEPDWSGDASFIVDAGSTTTTVAVTSSPVGTIEVGDRVLIPITSAGRPALVQRTAVAVGATTIGLDSALPAAPSAGAVVRTGGPLAQPVIDAIDAYFDGLGPGVYDPITGATWARHPDPAISGDDEVKLNALVAAVMAITGVFDVAFSVPLLDVRPPPQLTMRLGTLTIRHAS